MSTTTITGLPDATAGNITGATKIPVDDSASTTVDVSAATLRTRMFAGGTDFVAADPLVAGAITASGDVEIAKASALLKINATSSDPTFGLYRNGTLAMGFSSTAADTMGIYGAGFAERGRITAGKLNWGTTDITQMTNGDVRIAGVLWIGDGVTAPTARAGFTAIYVDTADGDLKAKFGDGTTKTIVVDT